MNPRHSCCPILDEPLNMRANKVSRDGMVPRSGLLLPHQAGRVERFNLSNRMRR